MHFHSHSFVHLCAFLLISTILRWLTPQHMLERVLVRTVVSILDRFHFPTELPAIGAAATGKPTLAQTVHSTVVSKVFRCIQSNDSFSQLLPNLYHHLTRKDGDALIVHTPVALAIVKLLLQLPQATLHDQVLAV